MVCRAEIDRCKVAMLPELLLNVEYLKPISDAFLGLDNTVLRPIILHPLDTESLNNQPTIHVALDWPVFNTPFDIII
jgi:hypothetical protein